MSSKSKTTRASASSKTSASSKASKRSSSPAKRTRSKKAAALHLPFSFAYPTMSMPYTDKDLLYGPKTYLPDPELPRKKFYKAVRAEAVEAWRESKYSSNLETDTAKFRQRFVDFLRKQIPYVAMTPTALINFQPETRRLIPGRSPQAWEKEMLEELDDDFMRATNLTDSAVQALFLETVRKAASRAPDPVSTSRAARRDIRPEIQSIYSQAIKEKIQRARGPTDVTQSSVRLAADGGYDGMKYADGHVLAAYPPEENDALRYAQQVSLVAAMNLVVRLAKDLAVHCAATGKCSTETTKLLNQAEEVVGARSLKLADLIKKELASSLDGAVSAEAYTDLPSLLEDLKKSIAAIQQKELDTEKSLNGEDL